MKKYMQVILTGAGMRFRNPFNTVDKRASETDPQYVPNLPPQTLVAKLSISHNEEWGCGKITANNRPPVSAEGINPQILCQSFCHVSVDEAINPNSAVERRRARSSRRISKRYRFYGTHPRVSVFIQTLCCTLLFFFVFFVNFVVKCFF
jgi:hypothetical protein